jgi:hypothetical protein
MSGKSIADTCNGMAAQCTFDCAGLLLGVIIVVYMTQGQGQSL